MSDSVPIPVPAGTAREISLTHGDEGAGALLNLDGYVRVSWVGDRGGPSFISPELQRGQIESWAKLHGARIGKVFEELNESGGRADRPLLLAAIERIERGESGGLVVAKLDRFGRSLIDGLSQIERILAAGGTFASVEEGLDLSTPTGRLVLRVMLSMAEWELERIGANWAETVRRAVDRGVHVGPTPFGYRRRGDGRLRPDPSAAPLVARIFAARAEGASVQALADLLNADGLQTAAGQSHFIRSSVLTILANRTYLGESRVGEHVNQAAHPALVEEATWRRAQRPVSAAPERSRASLLGGLLRCGSCRTRMMGSMGLDAGRMIRASYMCHGETSAGRCPRPAKVRADEAEGLFEELLFRAARRAPAARKGPRVSRAEADLAAAEDALAAYRDATGSRSALGSGRFARGLRRRHAEVERCLAALAEAREAAPPAPEVPAEIESLWPQMTLEERHRMLAGVLECAFVMPGEAPAIERLHVIGPGGKLAGMPGRGRPLGAIRGFDPARARSTRLPRPPRRSAEQVERELREWGGERREWPDASEFLRDGRARLYLEVWEWGGPCFWSRRLGWQIGTGLKLQWTPERIRGALGPYLEGRESFPTLPEFIALGAGPVRVAAQQHGGIDFWARELGVTYAPRSARRRRRSGGSAEKAPASQGPAA